MGAGRRVWAREETVLRGALPLHVQLRQAILRRVEQGEWPPGSQLPGERALVAMFGVSRTTVRQALEQLEVDGALIRRHGQGTFVARPPVVENLAALRGFAEELVEQGLDPQVQVLRAGPARAAPEAAQALGLSADAPIVEISRIVRVAGEPLFSDDSYLPASVGHLVLAAEPSRSIYSALEAVGFRIVRGEQSIEARVADRVEARLLGVPAGSPVLLIRRTAQLADGTPVEYRRAVYRADRYRYRITLVRRPPASAPASPP